MQKGCASADRNNCLLSSIAQAAGLVHPSQVDLTVMSNPNPNPNPNLRRGFSPQSGHRDGVQGSRSGDAVMEALLLS